MVPRRERRVSIGTPDAAVCGIPVLCFRALAGPVAEEAIRITGTNLSILSFSDFRWRQCVGGDVEMHSLNAVRHHSDGTGLKPPSAARSRTPAPGSPPGRPRMGLAAGAAPW